MDLFIIPNIALTALDMLIIVCIIFVAFQLIFYTVLALFGVKKPKREYKLAPDKKKFLFLIPACNEELVIQDTLGKLKQIEYKKDLYDFVCLVNNTIDNTLALAKKNGAKALDIKFEKGEPKGKPYVLKKYFDENEEWKSYDYIIILDADNLVSKRFLKELNSQIVSEKYERTEIIGVQCYLGIKNIATSLVSAGYSASYFFANRGVQYAKHRLGLNAAIGGTGFALKTDYIKEHGWNPKSYTEDFELQVELAVENKRTLWNHFARVYDEKPVTVKASHKQRLRWCQGHWYVAFTTTGKQIISLLFKSRSPKAVLNKLETLIYSYTMSRSVVITGILLIAAIIPQFRIHIPRIWSWALIWLVCQVLNYFVYPIYYILSEGKIAFSECLSTREKIRNFIMIYVGFFYTSFIYIAAQLVGFATCFKPQNNWVKTAHSMGKDDVIYYKEDQNTNETIEEEIKGFKKI